MLYRSKGRETKTRATKKKYQRGKNDSDDDDEEETTGAALSTTIERECISVEEIRAVLSKQEGLHEASEDVIKEIAARLYK